MSSTTTITQHSPIAPTGIGILAAYDIHQTGTDEQHLSSTSSTSLPRASRRQEGWPQDRRRVPTYRETDRSRDHFSERLLGEDWPSTILVTVMFVGNYIGGQTLRLWRNTVGKEMFRYPVGGEW
jgi:hypothetical protein